MDEHTGTLNTVMLDELQDPAFGFHVRVLDDEVVAELRVLLVELRTANQLLSLKSISETLGARLHCDFGTRAKWLKEQTNLILEEMATSGAFASKAAAPPASPKKDAKKQEANNVASNAYHGYGADVICLWWRGLNQMWSDQLMVRQLLKLRRRQQAAATIQRQYRRTQFSNAACITPLKAYRGAILVLQCMFRGARDRALAFAVQRAAWLDAQRQQQHRAVTRVQGLARGVQERAARQRAAAAAAAAAEKEARRRWLADKEARRHRAATRVQCAARGAQARSEMQREFVWAVTHIQCTARGARVRGRCKDASRSAALPSCRNSDKQEKYEKATEENIRRQIFRQTRR